MLRSLVILGLILIAIGIAWPWLSRVGFGRLPGDIVIERENFRLYIPLTSAILVSVALSAMIWLWRR